MSLFKVGQALGKTIKGLRDKYEEVVPENVRNNITTTTQQAMDKAIETTTKMHKEVHKAVEQTSDLVKEKSKELYGNLSEQNQQRIDQFQENFRDNVEYTKKASIQAIKKISDNLEVSEDSNNNDDKKNNKPKI